MSGQVACTIVANNYLAYARVLATSFRDRHPDGRFHVLFVDRRRPELDYDSEPFESWFVEDLGIPGFCHLAFRYSILELSTAVKPWFLRHLHERTGCSSALYLDPDILVLGPLDELYSRLDRADVVLTPHITEPLEDAFTPGERDFLLSGIYNLGFLGIAFRERTLRFLDWWHRRLEHFCLHAVDKGLFVDQRWMDLAPAFLDRVDVLREPGWNVAYWNLSHHRLAQRDGCWYVDEAPLRFFHFSGFMLDDPQRVSRFQNRLTLDGRPDIAPLFAEYGRLLRAAGHVELQTIPYAFGAFDDGTAIPVVARSLLAEVDPGARRWTQPFLRRGPDSFFDWLSGPDQADLQPYLPRIAVSLWERRADLRQVFPSLRGASRVAFTRWLVGRNDHGLDEALLAPVLESIRPHSGSPAEGVERTQRQVWHSLARFGSVPTEHFSREEIESLVEEAGPFEGVRPRTSRLGVILHRMRADVQARYPDPAGADRLGFALWFVTSGAAEYDLAWRLVAPVLGSLPPGHAAWALLWRARELWRGRQRRRRRSARQVVSTVDAPEIAPAAPPPPVSAAAPAGVNVIGWASAATGVGEACRGTLEALTDAGLPHSLWRLEGLTRHEIESGGGGGAPYEIDLLHVNADMMALVTAALPHWVTSNRYRIGYWFWELAHFPIAFASAFDHVDELWAPTKFCFDAYSALAPVPVRWVPPAVPARQATPRTRGELGVPEQPFLFLFAFDARSVPERKNPLGLIAAFERAQADSGVPIHLLLKINHADEAPALLAELRERTAGRSVTLETACMTREQTDALIASCDAFVSLHRSEGLGLPLIEAMQLRRPVIATGYGGCCDFLDDSVGWVVRHTMVPLRQTQGPYPVGAVWAEPDVDHAAELMARVAREVKARERKAAEAHRRVGELYAPEVAGARMRREVERIFASRRSAPALSSLVVEAPPRPGGGAFAGAPSRQHLAR